MNTDFSDEKLNVISRAVIGAAQAVSNAMGSGFLEKVYENALVAELRLLGHDVRQQCAVDVRYRKEIVGQYVADLIVDGAVLLLNFGRPRLEVHRVICGY